MEFKPAIKAAKIALSSCGITLMCGILAACSSTPVALCPAVVPYTQPQQDRAADELGTLPKPSMLGQMMADYGQLRDKLRACQ